MWCKVVMVLPFLIIAVRSCSSDLIGKELTLLPALSWDTWRAYRDDDGLIHTSPPPPVSGNGLLSTAEACLIMEFHHVRYPRNEVLNAIRSCKIEPGLYRRHKTQSSQEKADDYVGLAALASTCGYREIALEIVRYGENHGWTFQNEHSTALLQEAKLHYQASLGRYPGFEPMMRMAAGQDPGAVQMALWSASLRFTADNLERKDGDEGQWLLNWLTVQVYNTSNVVGKYRDAEDAKAHWWSKLRRAYPGGIKQLMKEYLEKENHPLELYVADWVDGKPAPVARLTRNLVLETKSTEGLGQDIRDIRR